MRRSMMVTESRRNGEERVCHYQGDGRSEMRKSKRHDVEDG